MPRPKLGLFEPHIQDPSVPRHFGVQVMEKNVHTVLGPVSSEKLGVTLTHEHVSLDFSLFYAPPPTSVNCFFQEKITLDTVGLVRQYPYGSKYNVMFGDDDTHSAVLRDVQLYRSHGGRSIAENTSHGLRRNLKFMKELQKQTGVNLIAGTGYYVAGVQPEGVLRTSEEKMYELMHSELVSGCEDCPDVRCGFIGEVGSGWPIHDFEKRAIQATAAVQAAVGCPVTFHPGRHPDAPFEIIRLFQEAGGDVSKAVMSHLDRTIQDGARLLEFAALGTYCQFDLFGTECSYYQLHPQTDMPSDAQRIDKIRQLLKDGKDHAILLAHDIHTKHRLVDFGGHGYSHLLINVLPRMLQKGISQEAINKITIDNPRTWLAY